MVSEARRLAGLTIAATPSTAITCSSAALVMSPTLARLSTSAAVGGRTDRATSAVPRNRAANPLAEAPLAILMASCWPAWLPLMTTEAGRSSCKVMSVSPIRPR